MDNLNQLIADARRGGWRFWRHVRQLRGAFVELADSTKNVELEKQLQSATQQLAEVNFRLNAVNGVMQTTQKELEEARAGNKKLADWIATTHRVDLKSTLGMKLFSAAKKATVLFVLCAGMDAAAQAPPIIRNPVTTNSITNGVISWVLTYFGPTLIGWSPMTGGSGIVPPWTNVAGVLRPNGLGANTNDFRIMPNGAFFFGPGGGWYSYASSPDVEGGTIYGMASTNSFFGGGAINLAINYLTNFWGAPSLILNIGGSADVVSLASNNAAIFNFGDLSGDQMSASNSFELYNFGDGAGAQMAVRDSFSIYNYGDGPGSLLTANASSQIHNFGPSTGSQMASTNSSSIFNFGPSSGFQMQASNSVYLFNIGREAGYQMQAINSGGLFNFGEYAGKSLIAMTSSNIYSFGGLTSAALTNSTDVTSIGQTAGNSIAGSFTNVVLIGNGSTAANGTANKVILGTDWSVDSVTGASVQGGGITLTNTPGTLLPYVRWTESNGVAYTEITVTNAGSTNRIVISLGKDTVAADQVLKVHSTTIAGGVNTIVLTNDATLASITSANAAFTSLLNSSNPAVVKTLSAGSNMTITDNVTNLVLASTGGGSGGGNWIGTRIGFNELFDDFLNSLQVGVTAVGEDVFAWLWGFSGTSGSAVAVNGETNLPPAPGIMRLTTGTTATGYAYLASSSVAPAVSALNLGQMAVTNVWRFRLSHLNDAGDSYTLRIGLGDDFDSESVDALGVRYTTNESHFIFYARNNSTESTITNTTTVASNTWYVAEIVVDSLSANATLRMGTTYAGLADSVTLTSNIPSGNGARSLGPWAQIQKDQGATSKYLEVDFCYVAYKLNADR